MLKAPILFFWWHLNCILTTSSWAGGNDTDNHIQTETILEQHILREKNGTVWKPKREMQKCAAILKMRLIISSFIYLSKLFLIYYIVAQA